MGQPSLTVRAVGVVLLLAVTCGIYSRVLDGAFIFDDAATVINNPSILHLWPLIGPEPGGGPLNPPPNRPTSARPLVNLTIAMNYALGGRNPAGYHAFNIGVHALTALLLWAIVWRTLLLPCFGGRFESSAGMLSFAAALVWAVHPLNTESVAYITQRTESMMGFFYLGALYVSLRFWEAGVGFSRSVWLLIATLCGLLGMLSKEMMASAIAMVLLYERTFVRGSFREALKQSWPLYVGLAMSFIPVVWINYHGPRTPLAGFHLGVPGYIWWLTQTEVALRFIGLAFWPFPLVIHYEIPYLTTISESLPWMIPISLLTIATIVLVWRHSAIGYVLAWFFAVLSPTLLIPLPGETMAERRMYVPLMAIVPLVVVSLYAAIKWLGGRITLPPKPAFPATWAILTVGLTLVFGMLTFHRLAAYQTELALWEDAIRYQPDDPLVQVNYGTSLAKAGLSDEAEAHFLRALELAPDDKRIGARAHFNLGDALLAKGLSSEAVSHFEEAVAGEPDDFFARFNLGQALLGAGKTGEAIQHFELAVKQRPDFAAAHTNLGVALTAVGRVPEAISHFEQAVKIEPDAESYVNLLRAYALSGRANETIAAWTKAIEHAHAERKPELAAELQAGLNGYRASTQGP